jgi:hypothetical protein
MSVEMRARLAHGFGECGLAPGTIGGTPTPVDEGRKLPQPEPPVSQGRMTCDRESATGTPFFTIPTGAATGGANRFTTLPATPTSASAAGLVEEKVRSKADPAASGVGVAISVDSTVIESVGAARGPVDGPAVGSSARADPAPTCTTIKSTPSAPSFRAVVIPISPLPSFFERRFQAISARSARQSKRRFT